MALYCLTYDLRINRNYLLLYAELEKFQAVRVLESVWFFHRLGTNASALCEHFMDLIDKDDGLVVTAVTDWAVFNTLDDPPK